jgi:hypothetical protein
LLVRVYPKDKTGRFEAVKRRSPDILFPEVPWEPAWLTPNLEDSYLLTNMLRHASVGVNVASTISLELCMFDKPVINVGFNPHGIDTELVDYARYYEFDHYRPVVASGAVKVVSSKEELSAMLKQALANPSTGRAERLNLVRSMFGDTLDGCSSERVAQTLISLAKRRGENGG